MNYTEHENLLPTQNLTGI